MVYSLETGQSGFTEASGMPIFDFLAQHPDEGALFSQAMVGLNSAEAPAVAASYDFSGFDTIVDVGGATGNMLGAILSRHAGPRGILFDRLPAGDTPHLGKIYDMVMLVFPGGQERTELEYASLLEKSGFRLNRVVPTGSPVSVVEAVPM